MPVCVKCGSSDFQEEDGFFFCCYCQTQSQGFAKEVAADDDEYYQSREVKVDDKPHEEEAKSTKRKRKTRDAFSKWTTIEAFNEIYLCMIEDFFQILKQNDCEIDENLFLNISMQLWFKYLRECEIAFLPNEHLSKRIKLHPRSRHRDNFLLGSESSTSADHVPLYRHDSAHKFPKNPQLEKLGALNYLVRSENRVESNNQFYFYDDIYPNKNEDARYYSQNGTSYSSRPSKSNSAQKILHSGKDRQNNKDEFLTYIEDLIVNPENDKDIVMDQVKEECNNLGDKMENEFLDDDNYHNVLVERMPFKTKNLHKIVPLKKIQDSYFSSPLQSDLISKPKLLSFLYITIRLMNLNIFLSDLIRWCAQGSIRYLSSLKCLPKFWEITWLDVNYFNDNRFPCYHKVVYLTGHLITHCQLSTDQFPETDAIEQLIKRYIDDLNLPKGLYLVVKKKYGHFVKSYRRNFTSDDDKVLVEFDVVAIVTVILALCDLFDLSGPTEKNFALFKDNSQFENLFIWPDWLEYSKLRLNMIKSFFLNLPSDYANLKFIDEILFKSQFESEYYRENGNIEKLSGARNKTRCLKYRFELQNLFNQLFFVNKNQKKRGLRSEILENENSLLSPTLNPLTTYSQIITAKVTNSIDKSKLESNFRCKLITPYLNRGQSSNSPTSDCADQPHLDKSLRDHTNSDSFQHLLDLGSIITFITCADLKSYYRDYSLKLKDF